MNSSLQSPRTASGDRTGRSSLARWFTEDAQTTDRCLSVSLPLVESGILEAKRYLAATCGSRYGIDPHVTLAISPLPEATLHLATAELDRYFADKGPVEVFLNDVEIDREGRFLYLSVESDGVTRWHSALTAIISQYRDGYIRAKDALRLEQGFYDKVEIANIQKFGFPRVNERFVPHVTLGSLEVEDVSIATIESHVRNLVSDVIGSTVQLTTVTAMYHTEAGIQTEMRIAWRKDYVLSEGPVK